MKIIDAHVHIFPDKIAVKASQSISDFYTLQVRYDGTVDTLLKVSEPAGVEQFTVHSVATTAAQVSSINSFIADTVKKYPGRFYGFATLHPDCNDIEGEIEACISHGLHGIKLHPDFQCFEADSPAAMRMYEIIDNRLPVLIHAGDFRKPYSKPSRILNMCRAFPRQTVIAAHLGGWSEWDECPKQLADCGIYVDTCSSQGFLLPHRVRELIDIFTPEKVFFGTDYPMWSPAEEITALKKILRDETEAENIFHLNFERMIGEY